MAYYIKRFKLKRQKIDLLCEEVRNDTFRFLDHDKYSYEQNYKARLAKTDNRTLVSLLLDRMPLLEIADLVSELSDSREGYDLDDATHEPREDKTVEHLKTTKQGRKNERQKRL